MAQDVTIAGASYTDVPSISVPKTGGGNASFIDTSDANATAGDIASGKTAYVDGVKLTGTGGGGTTTVIIPEQTVTASSSYTQLQYDSAIVAGEEYIITVNGTSRTKTAVEQSGSVYLSFDSTNILVEYTNTNMYLDVFNSSLYGSYTVKVEQETGGGGSTLITKSITANGTYNAEDDNADGYSEVTVNVPSANSWTKLASQEFTVNTTNTSNASVGDISIAYSDAHDKDSIIWVHIRDKAGKRTGYFYGHDDIFLNYVAANNGTTSFTTRPYTCISVNSSGDYTMNIANYGVFARSLYHSSTSHYVQIYSRYGSTYGTINGTYVCDVYKLTPPTGFTIFN